jgi:SNF2 family DNA or RNA helicase
MQLTWPSAHHIRTRSSQTFQAACAIKARHRWCLTGTPIHNSLDDYGALLSFVGVQPFTDKAAFHFWITEPIKQSQPNSLRRLEDLVRATCLRRRKSLNNALFKLPRRSEKVQWIELFPEDRELYTFFKLKTAKIASELSRRHLGAGKADQRKDTNILTLINFLRLICDHGEHLLPPSALEAWKTRKCGSIDWQMMRVCRARCDVCGVYVDEFDAPSSIDLEFQCQHSICPECAIRSQEHEADDGPACPKCIKQTASEGDSMIFQIPRTSVKPSAKVDALIRNLRQEQLSGSEGDQNLPRKRYSTSNAFLESRTTNLHMNSLVFSSWTKMLDLVQHHLELNGFIFQRIDGQSSLQKRRRAICQFSEDPKCTVMLASIGSAGEGYVFCVARLYLCRCLTNRHALQSQSYSGESCAPA